MYLQPHLGNHPLSDARKIISIRRFEPSRVSWFDECKAPRGNQLAGAEGGITELAPCVATSIAETHHDAETIPPCDGPVSGRTSRRRQRSPRISHRRRSFLVPWRHPRTLTRWAREGYIPAYPIGEGKRRLWRFRRHDLEDWMLGRRSGPAPFASDADRVTLFPATDASARRISQ
jgi:hypothetical protein